MKNLPTSNNNYEEVSQCLKLAVARLDLAHITGESDILAVHMDRFKDALESVGVRPHVWDKLK